jgi:membrane associated rhomboid family serine protease
MVAGVLLVAIWAACAYACYLFAEDSGHDPKLAIVLGALFGIFAVLGYLILYMQGDRRRVA